MVLFRTLCNPGIFRDLPYLQFEEYLESCKASMMQAFFEEPSVTQAYLEPWYTLRTLNPEYSEPSQASML